MLLLRPDYGETMLERAVALLERARGEDGLTRLWTLAAVHQLLHDEHAALAARVAVAGGRAPGRKRQLAARRVPRVCARVRQSHPRRGASEAAGAAGLEPTPAV